MNWPALTFCLALLACALPAASEEIVAGLSANRVAITANFDGSEILIYGAIKREEPAPEGPPLEVIVTIEGPASPLVVRRKEKKFGIWLNASSIKVDSAPSFYEVATTGPLSEILSQTEDLRHKISLPQTIRAIGIAAEAENPEVFLEALQRLRRSTDAYRIVEGSVQLVDETLFRADVVLPANLIEGNYEVRLFITRGGQVVDHMERVIGVRKTGLERTLYVLAHESPFLYGVLSLVLAAAAGWAASAGFRLLKR